MVDPISWQVAVTIIGSITVTVLGVAGFAAKHFNKKAEKDTAIYTIANGIENRTIKVETVVDSNTKQIDNLYNRLDNQIKRESEDLDRMNKKIDKLTDMMIDVLTSDKDVQK